MKSSASESKVFQSRSKGEIPGRPRRKERVSRSKLKQAFLIDSDAELFMYLIQCFRFGSWKIRRLNWALDPLPFSLNRMFWWNWYIIQLALSGKWGSSSSLPNSWGNWLKKMLALVYNIMNQLCSAIIHWVGATTCNVRSIGSTSEFVAACFYRYSNFLISICPYMSLNLSLKELYSPISHLV